VHQTLTPVQEYHIEFRPLDLRVFKEAVIYRLREEQRKSPFWGRDNALFKWLKCFQQFSETHPQLPGLTTDRFGARCIIELLLPLIEELGSKKTISTNEEQVCQLALASIARILDQLPSPWPKFQLLKKKAAAQAAAALVSALTAQEQTITHHQTQDKESEKASALLLLSQEKIRNQLTKSRN
jgi:hypothetical protein